MSKTSSSKKRRRTTDPVTAGRISSEGADTIHPPAAGPAEVLSDHVDTVRPPRTITAEGPIIEIEAAFERSDFAEALRLAEAILHLDSENADAARIARSARIRLRHLFIAKYGSTTRTPSLAASPAEIGMHRIDATTGFVLALVGSATIEDILDIVPKPEHETLAILGRLIDLGLITIERSPK